MTKPVPYIINVNKPKGMGSFDAVRHFKRKLQKPYGKIGHMGTLDPFATGVLLIAVGGAAKLNDYIHKWFPKTYRAVGILGVETPTGDLTVEPSFKDEGDFYESLKNMDVEELKEKMVKDFLAEKEYWQVPPIYSATKFKGRPLHEWAREGVEVIKDPVKREITHLEILRFEFPEVEFEVTASSGTYIRVLFQDMAKKIGTVGTLQDLERSQIGPFLSQSGLMNSKWPEEEVAVGEIGTRVDKQIPLRKVVVKDTGMKKYMNGRKLGPDDIGEVVEGELSDTLCWVLGPHDELLGLGDAKDKEILPRIVYQNA